MKIIMMYCRGFCLVLSLTLLSACASDPLSLAAGDTAFKEWYLFFFPSAPDSAPDSPPPDKVLLAAYSDEFEAAPLDTDKWHERLNGWRDQNPPVPWTWGTISPQVSGYFHPGRVRIGMVANQMGVTRPFGGDGKAHFDYIRVYRR